MLDVVRNPKMFDRDRTGPNEGPPTLDRWTVDLADGKVRESRLDDHALEFPRIDERLVGKRHRYGYTPTVLEGIEGAIRCSSMTWCAAAPSRAPSARKRRWVSSCSILHRPMRPRTTAC